MAINERLIDTAVSGCSAEPPEEGLKLHLDANDVDSYDGDGDIWYDIKDHEYTPTTNVSEHFNTVLYDGNGGTKEVTGVGFQPDLVWIKRKNGSGDPGMIDTLRGNNSALFTNSNSAESALTGGNISMDLDGFDINTYGSTWANLSGGEYVAWCFKAGGAAVLNEEGTIDSQVSANNDLGFSIVNWGGNQVFASTVGHGLGVAPELIIIKNLSSALNWSVYSEELGAGYKLILNETNQASATSNYANTSPTSSVFSLSGGNEVNTSNSNYIAYCFASKRGVSKVGSYTGDGGTSNKVYTGFEPAFVMVKRTDSTSNWRIFDNVRGTEKELYANSNAVEPSDVAYIDFNRDGFTLTNSGGWINSVNSKFIYYAIAKNTNETSLIPDTDLELHLDAASFDGSTNTPSTWTDSSSNSNNGTISGATFDAELGNWLDFDGSNDKVTLPSTFLKTTKILSVEVWVKFDTISQNFIGIVENFVGNVGGWDLDVSSSTSKLPRFQFYNGSSYSVAQGTTALTTGKWYHLCGTISAQEVKLYVNGSLEATTSYSVDMSNTTQSVVIGGDGVSTSFLDGKVGQCRIYGTALTEAQVRQNYNFTKPNYPNGYNFIGNNMDSADWNTNGYFSFNGTNEHFSDTSFTPSLTDVQTVSYWVRNSAISGNETVYSIGQTGSSNAYSWISFGYDSSSGQVRAFYSDSVGNLRNGTKTNSAYISSDWQHHCFLIFPENRGTSSQCFKVYIDGVEVAVTNSTTSTSLPTVQGYSFIGKYSRATSDISQFSGDLSSLLIYDRRLTEAEITDLHCKGR